MRWPSLPEPVRVSEEMWAGPGPMLGFADWFAALGAAVERYVVRTPPTALIAPESCWISILVAVVRVCASATMGAPVRVMSFDDLSMVAWRASAERSACVK